MVVFGQSGCIRAKVVVIGQKWFSSGKSSFIREKRLFSGRSGRGPTATLTSLKVTWNEGPDQAIQGKQLFSRNYAAYAP